MRGKECIDAMTETQGGITPAYAGKRRRSQNKGSYEWDHPRLCGEKRALDAIEGMLTGSPPPMRGKESMFAGNQGKEGITPAYAGKSVNVFAVHLNRQDHPRLCGEK